MLPKDAEELLVYMYKQKLTGQPAPSIAQLAQTTKWDNARLTAALDFLVQKGLIEGKSVKVPKPSLTIGNVTTDGIDVVESPAKFKKLFNSDIKLGIYKYSWASPAKSV